VQGFGFALLDNEIAIFKLVNTNLGGKNDERQYLVGSFTGAVSS
jgi:hypothetical protein